MRDASDQIMWVVVADGEKTLLFRNDDTDRLPFLTVIDKKSLENPLSHHQGADRPGRTHESGPAMHSRSALQDTDWHQLGKERFARELADKLNKAALRDAFDRLVIFAPPQVLGQLRAEYHAELKRRILKEVASDLTKHSVDEIERRLADALKA
jgi:protein required for attachment to host cells